MKEVKQIYSILNNDELLKMYSQGQPIPFKASSVKLLEDIKMFLLRAPMGGNKKGTISQNTAST